LNWELVVGDETDERAMRSADPGLLSLSIAERPKVLRRLGEILGNWLMLALVLVSWPFGWGPADEGPFRRSRLPR
jgi:hypothetical protein